MLATECCRTLCSTEQIEHHLRFELRCKSSSLYHSNPLSWAYYTSWLSLRQVSNPWGALQSNFRPSLHLILVSSYFTKASTVTELLPRLCQRSTSLLYVSINRFTFASSIALLKS